MRGIAGANGPWFTVSGYPTIRLQTAIGTIVSGLNAVCGRIAFYLNHPYIGLNRSQYVSEEPHYQDHDRNAPDISNGLDGRC